MSLAFGEISRVDGVPVPTPRETVLSRKAQDSSTGVGAASKLASSCSKLSGAALV
jgi:hypothetical protein